MSSLTKVCNLLTSFCNFKINIWKKDCTSEERNYEESCFSSSTSIYGEVLSCYYLLRVFFLNVGMILAAHVGVGIKGEED